MSVNYQKTEDYSQLSAPYNLDMERFVLGAILMDPDKLLEIKDILSAMSFYDLKHRFIYQTILELEANNRAINLFVIIDYLEANSKLDRAGGEDYLHNLTRSIHTTSNVLEIAQQVHQKSNLRSIIRLCEDVIQESRTSADTPEVIADKAAQELIKIAAQGSSDSFKLIDECIKHQVNVISANSKLRAEGQEISKGLHSGFTDLDDICHGFQSGDLIIVGARPSVGKTAFALNLAANVAIQKHKVILFFSLEMQAEKLAMRILSSESQIESSKLELRYEELSFDETSHFHQAVQRLCEAKIYIDDSSSLRISDIRARARRKKEDLRRQGINVDLIIVDYLQFISPGGSINREQQVSEISRGLKQLARELEVPIIACAQLNRKQSDRKDDEKWPQLSDLRESGAIEQDADLIIFLHREAQYKITSPEEFYSRVSKKSQNRLIKERQEKENGFTAESISRLAPMPVKAEDLVVVVTDVIVAKHRNGPTGNLKLIFHRDKTKFRTAVIEEGGKPKYNPNQNNKYHNNKSQPRNDQPIEADYSEEYNDDIPGID